MVKDGTTSLALMSRAAQMLAEANTVQKAKELKDLALTAADWAKRKKLGQEAVANAERYARLAERRMGQFLQASERAKGAAAGGKKQSPRGPYREPRDSAPTLAELGITKKESAKAQQLADLPDDDFERVLDGTTTVKAVTKEAKKKRAAKAMKAAQAKVTAQAKAELGSVCDVRHCSMRELLTSGINPDCIVTDPPYPEKFLPVYGGDWNAVWSALGLLDLRNDLAKWLST